MYKSSPLTFLFKYLFTPIWAGGFILGIISTWKMNDQFSYNWSRGAMVMVSWALMWLIILMIRLRNVEASNDKFIIKRFRGSKIIDYRDIEWVYQIALISPILISLKYYDKEFEKSRRILLIPGMSSQLFLFSLFGEAEMTKFIRERIKKAKPGYIEDLEPSRWVPIGLIFLTSIPITFIVSNYFMSF